jgi:Zn-dependent protease with chaperone function
VTALLLIALYLGCLLFALPRLLTRANWFSRAPRAGAAVWLAVDSAALLAAIVILLGILATPSSLGHLAIGVLRLCIDGWDSLPHRLEAHLADGFSAVVLIAMVTRLGHALAAVLRGQHCRRTALRDVVRIFGQHRADLGVTVLPHDQAAAWSIPGRPTTVVITSAAMEQLTPRERSAVFAHERAHLRQRHAGMLTASAVLLRAFPRLPLTVLAHAEIGRLLEMAADDSAANETDARTVAGALVGLAVTATPRGTLAANSLCSERAWRLLQAAPPLSGNRRRTIALLAVGAFAFPALAVVVPALSDGSPHCRLASSARVEHLPTSSASPPSQI